MFYTMKDMMSFEECVSLMNKKKYPDAPVNEYGMTDFNKEGKRPWGVRYKISYQEFGILAGKSLNPLIYRGENKEYKYFIPSAKRGIYSALDKKKLEIFLSIYKKTPYYKLGESYRDIFNYKMKLDLEAIAQHYGFKTNYIDITRLREIAEFFAYTYYDKDGYHPITDFTEYTPCLYIADLHDVYKEKLEAIKLISGQIALRPCNQAAMAIDICDYEDCKKIFQKEILPKDKNKAKEVYEKNCKKLFSSDDALGNIAELIHAGNISDSSKLLNDKIIEEMKEHVESYFLPLLNQTNCRIVSK